MPTDTPETIAAEARKISTKKTALLRKVVGQRLSTDTSPSATEAEKLVDVCALCGCHRMVHEDDDGELICPPTPVSRFTLPTDKAVSQVDDVAGVVERLRGINRNYDLARGIHITVTEAATLLEQQAQDLARIREVLTSIRNISALGKEIFEARVHDRKDRLTWWAVNILQDHLACAGGEADRALSSLDKERGE